MLILGCGANTVRFRPALNVPVADLEKGIEISRKAAKAVFKK
jgi:L-lysine 6-transaminase